LHVAGKILFLPDQHLGRNTGFAMGIPLERDGGPSIHTRSTAALRPGDYVRQRSFCGKGTAPSPALFARARGQCSREVSGIQVIVHPECRWSLPESRRSRLDRAADPAVSEAPEGSMFCIGTEIHLVNRLAKEFSPKGKKIITLDDTGCLAPPFVPHQPAASGLGRLRIFVEGRVVNRQST